jgi:hypothetical protein
MQPKTQELRGFNSVVKMKDCLLLLVHMNARNRNGRVERGFSLNC